MRKILEYNSPIVFSVIFLFITCIGVLLNSRLPCPSIETSSGRSLFRSPMRCVKLLRSLPRWSVDCSNRARTGGVVVKVVKIDLHRVGGRVE